MSIPLAATSVQIRNLTSPSFKIQKREFPTSETLGRMGTSIGCSDFGDRLDRKASVMIGRVDGIHGNH